MSLDREFKSWQQEWQSEATPLPDLRQRVRQQSRFMWIMLAFEAAVTVGVGGGFSIWAWRSRQTDITVLAACAWGFIAVAWWFAIANRRRSWRAPAETTQAYLELTIRRCRGALSAIRFGFFLYFAEIVFCVAWLFRHNLRKGENAALEFFTSTWMVGVYAISATFVAAMFWYRAKRRRELASLLRLSEEIAEGSKLG